MRASYAIDGLIVLVYGSSAPLRALDMRFRSLSIDTPRRVDFEIEIVDGLMPPEPVAPSDARTVYDPPVGTVWYSDELDLLAIDVGGGITARCCPARSTARIWTGDGTSAAVWVATHAVFTLCLLELMRSRARFNLHAASLAFGGAGLLVAGSSGAGKSTLTIALLRGGFTFLGDDTCFVASQADGVGIVALPDEIDLTETTVSFFPELAPLASRPPGSGSSKRQLRPEEIYRDVVYGGSAEPVALVFPTRSSSEASSITPIAPEQALVELAPNVLLTSRTRSRAHFEALAALLRATRCYQFSAGRDFDRMPALFRTVLEGDAAADLVACR